MAKPAIFYPKSPVKQAQVLMRVGGSHELTRRLKFYSVYEKNLNPFKFRLPITSCSNLTALIALN
jgi:hypothetical protein